MKETDFRIRTITLRIINPPEGISSRARKCLANVSYDDATGCWLWVGYTDKDGYGKWSYATEERISFRSCTKRKRLDVRAHRFLYEELRGPVPRDLALDHLCRNRGCVNPWHLEPVTAHENYRRGLGPMGIKRMAEQQRTKTHCPEGHEYSGWNLIVFKSGSRACRKCMYRRNREYKAKIRGELTHVESV